MAAVSVILHAAVQGTAEPLAAAGLVDLDASILVQLGIFAVFGVLLNVLVVRPMRKTQEARFARMEGARQEAEGMDLRAAEAHGEYEKNIETARQAAFAIRDEIRDGAESAATASVANVRSEASRLLAAGREELAASGEKARVDAEPTTRELAETIASHLLAGSGGAR